MESHLTRNFRYRCAVRPLMYATEVAVEAASQAFRYGGGRALYNTSVLQRCLRDLNAAAQHFMVNDTSYENHGQFMLGMPGIDPMS